MTAARTTLSVTNVLVWLLGATVLAPALLGGTISWELYDAPCASIESALEVACGDYGDFYFEVESSACDPIASGSEQSTSYPGLPVRRALPQLPGGASRAVGEQRSVTFGGSRSRAAGAIPWTAVIDWQDFHGFAVAWLVYYLGGVDIPTTLYYLDDPSLAPLGAAVGDQHLLASICAVVDAVDSGDNGDLLSLNLSLGRAVLPGDPVPGVACPPGRLSCQIDGVITHLEQQGTPIIAAAGNHQQLLFPAMLDSTLAIGGLDVGSYFVDGRHDATWETPATIDGLMPGNALCTFGTTAPAGASMAAGLFSGWLTDLMDSVPGIDPYAGGEWLPVVSETTGCPVLQQGAVEHTLCNPRIGAVLQGIAGGSQSGCWESADDSLIVDAPPPGMPEQQPDVPGLDRWVATTLKPAPEEDPCIPCADDDSWPRAVASDDLMLNLTRSLPLSSGTEVAALYLRSGDDFYPIELAPEDLDRFARAEIDGLRLPGFRPVLDPESHPSLYYVLRKDPQVDCDLDPDSCYWHSTQIFIYPQ